MTEHVSPDNFIRAETDLYFGNVVRDGVLGRFKHFRDFGPLDNQLVVRQNRDTLYSVAVFDLEAGPVAVTLPDAGDRFRSLQVITEDHYVPEVIYTAGRHTFDRDGIGTRYVMLVLRVLVDPTDPADLATVHALQDGITVDQRSAGSFEVPDWDPVSQKAVRDALITLFGTLPDSRQMFGPVDEVDPVRRLIGAAAAWGGNPERDALYLTVNPDTNDGQTVHRLTVGDVPVDGFWSVTVYNAEGYFTPNPADAYSVNSVTGVRDPDGSVTIQFGGAADLIGDGVNHLPVTPGWNYLVRLYRPRPEVLDGSWTFPAAEPV
ncbi:MULTISPECIES: DUF1254 domain-containing protein [Mycolicibacterium]|jgi:hypothetical protein|uniref:DUF1254 domain-containing protein n=1 Tax=Mycolicibacterium TaxID=1866885 RepID=UPI0005613B0D|nr:MULTISPECIES: DUF1254 domain-containing protein [Mycolicibacterium]QZT59449.1 DUF1254 domain-containing protein [Mycolicibacterium austroafricanum]QZY48712.1 DUF1254 domain-containing protein [Mycolicibacterium austroafricanum]UJL27231.1 DUF1254 domain-containing protein [Mycolicibacterium vanbaalenii]WND59361.1 DUF1254 domain-containing protein [Mycolicibacterium vanbaalenii]